MMLPTPTNRYGDMLKDVLSGLQGVDQFKLDMLQREMNELWQRETKYKSWLRLQDNKIDFKNLDLPFEPIYSTVFEEDKSQLVIAIPQNYKHLMIMGQARLNGTGGQTAVYTYGQFNGDTANNYSLNILYQAGVTHNVTESLLTSGMVFSYLTADGADANYNGSTVCFIPHYTSNFYKTVLTFDGVARDAATSVALWQGVWKSTTPINSIRIYPDTTYPSAKIVSGSLFSIYGIK